MDGFEIACFLAGVAYAMNPPMLCIIENILVYLEKKSAQINLDIEYD